MEFASLLQTAPLGITGDPVDVPSFTKLWGLFLVDIIFPWFRGIGIQNIIEELEFKESSVEEVFSKDCTEGSTEGNLGVWCLRKGQSGGIYGNVGLVEEEEEAELHKVSII